MIINSFNINESDMPAAQTTRTFTVTGSTGAQFRIIALQNPSSSSAHTLYYDFLDSSFESGHNDLNNNLLVTLTTEIYRNNIVFQSGGRELVIKLMPLNETTIQNKKNNIITKSISKASAQTVVTFSPATNNSANYATFPTTTSTGDVTSTSLFRFNWDIINASTDAGGFGLRLISDESKIGDSYWYFKTTEAVGDNPAGDGEDSNTVKVADTSDLSIGTELYYHKGTTVPTNSSGASGTTLITSINTSTGIITFDKDVAFEDSETMTFRAYGSTNINRAIGLLLEFQLYPTVTPSILTQTVRTDISSSTSITLSDTLGVSGGNVITYTGVGVNNASANAITSVTPDPGGGDADGVMVVQLAQTLAQGVELTFNNIHKQINFNGFITISRYPTANKTIYLDLDKVITVGTAS